MNRMIQYNPKLSVDDLVVLDCLGSCGAKSQTSTASYKLKGKGILFHSSGAEFETGMPDLVEGDRICIRYIKNNGTISQKLTRYAIIKKTKEDELVIPGKERPKKNQITVTARVYATHTGVIDGIHPSDNTSLTTSGLLYQLHEKQDLFNRVADEHRRVRNSCIQVTTAELEQIRDEVIIPSCKAFNTEQGRSAKVTYKQLADTKVDKDIEYGHITRFHHRELKTYIKNHKGDPQPMYKGKPLVEYLNTWTDKINKTIDYSAINKFDVPAVFASSQRLDANGKSVLYRTIYDKTVSSFKAILIQRDTKQKKSKDAGDRALGFHQGWPKSTASSKNKRKRSYSVDEEIFYFLGKGSSEWSIPRRLSEGGGHKWKEFLKGTSGAVRFYPPVAPQESGHPNMSPDSLQGKRQLRKMSYQYASTAPFVELAVLFDESGVNIDPEAYIAQVILCHKKNKGLYMNFVVNQENVELKESRTTKTVAIVPHFKRVGDHLEILTGVDSDGGRLTFTLPLNEDWSALMQEIKDASKEPSKPLIPKNPNSIRSLNPGLIVKDEVYFQSHLSWKSIYASGVEETPGSAKADIAAIAAGISDLTLTNHDLLYGFNSLSWSEKISALRNAVNTLGDEFLTKNQRNKIHWDLLGYRGLKELLNEQRVALRLGKMLPSKGLTPSTQDEKRKMLPYIPKLYQTLKLWERLSDRCYKYQTWGKGILTERIKNIYFLYAHRLLKTYGTVQLWNPDLEGLQKSKNKDKESENAAIESSSKFRQWASLSTFKSALISASQKYSTELEIYSYKNFEKGLRDLSEKGIIKLVVDVNPNKCAICGAEGSSTMDTIECAEGHTIDRYENRALLMLNSTPKALKAKA